MNVLAELSPDPVSMKLPSLKDKNIMAVHIIICQLAMKSLDYTSSVSWIHLNFQNMPHLFCYHLLMRIYLEFSDFVEVCLCGWSRILAERSGSYHWTG